MGSGLAGLADCNGHIPVGTRSEARWGDPSRLEPLPLLGLPEQEPRLSLWQARPCRAVSAESYKACPVSDGGSPIAGPRAVAIKNLTSDLASG